MAGYASILLPILSTIWQTKPAQPTGIVNTGKATCYFSSVLQCFGRVPLVANVQPGSWKLGCGCPLHSHCWLCYPSVWIAGRNAPGYNAKEARPVWAVDRIHGLLPGSSQPRLRRNRPAAPSDTSEPNQIDWNTRRFSHEDPDELLRKWIGWVGAKDRPEGYRQFLQHFFGSSMLNERCCPGCCTRRSFTEDAMIVMPQYVEEGRVCRSVAQGLDFMTSKSLLHNYKCDHCGRKNTSFEQSKFHTLPNVLVLSLPRTEYTVYALRKLAHRIAFSEVLDLASWLHPGSPDLGGGSEYDLVGVVQHHGKQAAGGHCTANCRTAAPDGSLGNWFQFDDERVILRTLDEVLGTQACMLWYQRKLPRQNPIPINGDTEIILTKPDAPSSSSSNSLPAPPPLPAAPIPASPAAPLDHLESVSSILLLAEVGPPQPASSSASVPEALPLPQMPNAPIPLHPAGPESSAPSSSSFPQLKAPHLPASPDSPSLTATIPHVPVVPVPLPHAAPILVSSSSPCPAAASPIAPSHLPPAADSVRLSPSTSPSSSSPLQPTHCAPPAADLVHTSSSAHSHSPPMATAGPTPLLPLAEARHQNPSPHSLPPLPTALRSSSSPHLPSSFPPCSTHELTDAHVSIPSTALSPDHGIVSGVTDNPTAHTKHCCCAASTSSMSAHDADTLPSTLSLTSYQQQPICSISTDSALTKPTDNTGGCNTIETDTGDCGAAHTGDCGSATIDAADCGPTGDCATTFAAPHFGAARVEATASSPPASVISGIEAQAAPFAANTTGALELYTALSGESATSSPTASCTSGLEGQGLLNSSKLSERPSSACGQQGLNTGATQEPAVTTLTGSNASGHYVIEESTDDRIRPKMAAHIFQPTRCITRSQTRQARAEAAQEAAASAETPASSPVQHPTPLQQAKHVSKAADKTSGRATGKAADRAAVTKRKRVEEGMNDVPEQPNKRCNTRQATICTALPTAAARSAAPASVSKRKRADEVSEDDAEYLPAQPSKRQNVTSHGTQTAPAMPPRRSARQTKNMNYCELEDTDMPDVDDDQPAPKGGKTAKSKKSKGRKPVRPLRR